MARKKPVRGAIRFLLENSLFLIGGAALALFWANTSIATYQDFKYIEIFRTHFVYDHQYAEATGVHAVTLNWLVNDVLMALFFAIAGKEVWEATLPGGALSEPKKAGAPLIATIGGMAGPAGLYLLGAVLLGQFSDYANGWAIPCATDIAFSYMVARLVFGAGHPAIPFLLLLAIADDAIGLIILAVFYPQGELHMLWMLLPVGGIIVGLLMKRFRVHSFWPYILIAGAASWLGFAKAGLHPALGLLPIIPTMPHAHVDSGLFNWAEMGKQDTLNRFEHWWKNPVELILGMFGLLNAGVVMSSIGNATYLVLAGLLVGKPLGIWLCGWVATLMGFKLPDGMNMRDLWVVGCAAGIGFTVALFISVVAFKAGPIQDAAKMGALASFGAAVVTFVFAKLLRVQKAGA